MQGTRSQCKRYYVSKQFYRFKHPGAKMLEVNYNEQNEIFVSAYELEQMQAVVLVIINSTNKQVNMKIEGSNMSETFEMYQTTATENCEKKQPVNKGTVDIPPATVVTLVNGKVFEQ
jgi:O-glycosyl hydrolase